MGQTILANRRRPRSLVRQRSRVHNHSGFDQVIDLVPLHTHLPHEDFPKICLGYTNIQSYDRVGIRAGGLFPMSATELLLAFL